MSDSLKRSIVKALSWRFIGTVDTFLLAFLFTGSLVLATGISATELITKIIIYYFHERIWNKIKWGKNEINRTSSKS